MSWMVVGIYKDKRVVKKPLTSEEADKYIELKEKEFEGRGVKLYKVSIKDRIPLDESIDVKKIKNKKRLYWCPYCGDYRNFKSNDNGSIRCPVCTISTLDFYVRSINHLWD